MGYDFLAETVFEDISKLQEFIEYAQARFEISEPLVFSIVDEIKKERFLSRPEHWRQT